MTERGFIIKEKIFLKRKLSTLQHKLRVVLKCYTIREFSIKEENKFTFKKSYRINGIKIDDKKEILGEFRTEKINDNEIKLIISVYGPAKD